jgi:glycosyltransferase involved in cell wall biosynthesis
MLKIEDIKKIKAPIVWSLQDMWPFTGGCHFTNDCDRYLDKCGLCKTLSSKFRFDLSSIVYYRKKKTFKKINKLIINGPSKWMSDCAKKSSLFNKNKIINLPNTIDTDLFRPIDKKISRTLFGIPNHKKVVLFGASNVNDPRKGYVYLLSALSKINADDLILVVAGQSKPKNPIKIKFPVYYIPPVSDDVSLAQMYNVADVVLMPSLEDNLPNTIMESLSCGVPVVAFEIGGHSDMIDHKKNGYLASAKDASDFADGINWTLNNMNTSLTNNARQKVLNSFSYSVVVKRYIKLYKDILSNQI